MSQPSNAVLNGPSPENNVPFKDAQVIPDMVKTQLSNNGSPQQTPGYATAASPRPPLTRLDSRSTLPTRPPFPPQQIIRSQQAIRPAFSGQQQFQRIPGQVPRPPNQSQFNPGVRSVVNPNFRPSTPFPRPQIPPQAQTPRQPGIFQQRSVPAYPQTRPIFESEQITRSQTLDSTDLLVKQYDSFKEDREEDEKASLNLLESKSYNLSSTIPETTPPPEEATKPYSKVSDDKRAESIESIDKKSDGDYPSRPESRASSRMAKIIEDNDNIFINKPSSPVTEPQKSVDFILPPEEPKIKPPPSPIYKIEKEEDSITSKPKEIINGFVEPKIEKNLELKNLKKIRSPSRSEGDNDSGVDESTQGNDQSSNGDQNSPRKSSGKLPTRISSTTPTKNRSLSRGSKSPSLKSPDSTASTPGTADKKKVPMNKVQVGSTPSPNLKVVRSKIGSLDNTSYRPGGGHVKIENKKIDFKNASSRIEAKNEKYTPKGGDKKIQQQKLQWNAKSKIGSLENTTHKPKGGDKKIETVKLDFKEKAKPKVGSKDNMKHTPGGGDVKIENKKIDLKAESKIGSLDNVKHRPGGGDKKIFDDKDYLKQISAISSENQSLSGSQNSLPSQPEAGGPVADENLNQER